MINRFDIRDSQVLPCDDPNVVAPITVFTAPTEAEKKQLCEEFGIDEHTINSALDPDEQARLDFDPGYLAILYKRPRNLSGPDRFLFKVSTAGLFLIRGRLVIVVQESVDVFGTRIFKRVRDLDDIVPRIMSYSITHFLEHIKVITMISDEMEVKIQGSMENKYLLALFSLEKSMVYYVSALSSNVLLIDKLKINAQKYGFDAVAQEFLDELAADANQALHQAEMHSNILASMMDARASIVANNLNGIMKTLSFITIGIMMPNLVLSLFSMNVGLPFPDNSWWPFWVIVVAAGSSVFAFYWLKKKMKW